MIKINCQADFNQAVKGAKYAILKKKFNKYQIRKRGWISIRLRLPFHQRISTNFPPLFPCTVYY
jgi:hypothetical protein